MGALKLQPIFMVLVFLSIAGCGGSGGIGTDTLAPTNHQGVTTTPDQNTPTPTGSGAVLSYAMSLNTVGSSGTTSVGANSTVIATATLKDNNGKSVANQMIKFREITLDGISSVSIGVPVTPTSSEGIATTFLQTSNTDINKDVIIEASTSINDQLISSMSIFKIVRSIGNYINFITTKSPTDPDGNLNTLKVDLHAIDPHSESTKNILQLITFEVLDKNGFNRTEVPVKLEIFDVSPPVANGCIVHINSPVSPSQTITTDDTGLGVFSAYVTLNTPPIGSENSCSVIYKATTTDIYSDTPKDLFSYGAYIVKLVNNLQ